jgi:hypothetical protein
MTFMLGRAAFAPGLFLLGKPTRMRLEQFQEKCVAVFRPELRKTKT